MNKLKRFLISLSTLLLLSGVGLSATAGAEGGHDTVTGDSPKTSESDQIATTSDNTSTDDTTGGSSSLTEHFKKSAELNIEQERKTGKIHSEAEREKSCTARKASLTKRMANAVTQAERHKAVFDKIYGKVKDFYTAKNLTVADYAALTAKVDTAQANAQASIDALKSLDVSVDCTYQTVAESVSAFQQAVKSSRDSLKAYRSSLVDLIKAVKTAAGTSEDSTSNSTNQ
jgi:hypothetical protein